MNDDAAVCFVYQVDLAQSFFVPRFVGGGVVTTNPTFSGVNGDQEKKHAAFIETIARSDLLQKSKERYKFWNPVEAAVGEWE